MLKHPADAHLYTSKIINLSIVLRHFLCIYPVFRTQQPTF